MRPRIRYLFTFILKQRLRLIWQIIRNRKLTGDKSLGEFEFRLDPACDVPNTYEGHLERSWHGLLSQ